MMLANEIPKGDQMIKSDHIAVWVTDIEKQKAFYQKHFNAKQNSLYINKQKSYRSYFLTFDSSSRLEIMQRSDVQPVLKDSVEQEFIGFAHLAFSVGSEERVEKLTQQLELDGYRCISVTRRTKDGYYESVILDPENNRVEITA